jgi:hypothetical protein
MANAVPRLGGASPRIDRNYFLRWAMWRRLWYNPAGLPHRGHVMSDHATGKEWQEAQARVLLDEFRAATGKAARSIEEAEGWFATLPLVERDRVGRRLNDPEIIGWHLQTPRIQ